MQIKPRQHLLEMWRAIARHSSDEGERSWGEWGRPSSVADAERPLRLRRARRPVDRQPGTAHQSALGVLGGLDVLARVRATDRGR